MRALLFVVMAACSFRPSSAPGDGPFGAGSDGPAAPDAPIGSDAGVTPTCATPGAVQDTFGGTVLSTQWIPFAPAGSMVVVNNGSVQLKTGSMPNASAGIFSRHAVNLTGGHAEVEILGTVGNPGISGFSLGTDAAHYLVVYEQNNILTTGLVDGASNLTAGTAFDAGQMKYWRVSESGGMVSFATSPDGSAWTTRNASVPTPTWIGDVYISLNAIGQSGMATFTNVDTLQQPAPWCSVGSLHDHFNSGDEQWLSTPPAMHCMFQIAAGATLTESMMAGPCAFGTSHAWDFAGAATVLKWGAITPAASASFEPLIGFVNDAGTSYAIYVSDTQICAPTPTSVCTAYSFQPTGKDGYWKLAEAAGTFVLSSSADAVTWTSVLSSSDPFTPMIGTIELGAVQTSMPAASITFDAVN